MKKPLAWKNVFYYITKFFLFFSRPSAAQWKIIELLMQFQKNSVTTILIRVSRRSQNKTSVKKSKSKNNILTYEVRTFGREALLQYKLYFHVYHYVRNIIKTLTKKFRLLKTEHCVFRLHQNHLTIRLNKIWIGCM